MVAWLATLLLHCYLYIQAKGIFIKTTGLISNITPETAALWKHSCIILKTAVILSPSITMNIGLFIYLFFDLTIFQNYKTDLRAAFFKVFPIFPSRCIAPKTCSFN